MLELGGWGGATFYPGNREMLGAGTQLGEVIPRKDLSQANTAPARGGWEEGREERREGERGKLCCQLLIRCFITAPSAQRAPRVRVAEAPPPRWARLPPPAVAATGRGLVLSCFIRRNKAAVSLRVSRSCFELWPASRLQSGPSPRPARATPQSGSQHV